MKEFIISVLEVLECIKKIDMILGIVIISIILILILIKSDTRKSLVSVVSECFNLFKIIIFQSNYIGTVFVIILLISGGVVLLLTESIVTSLLFFAMPFKNMYKEIENANKDNETPISKIFARIFWEFEKSFLGYSITYYLLLLELPTELKKAILYGYQSFVDRVINGDLDVIIILFLLSLCISFLIAIFITDAKRFAIIEQDIWAINRKSKYNRLSKAQIQGIIIETKYFKNVKIKAEILKVIAGFNKYDHKDFKKLLKSSMQIYSFLRVKASDRKQFLNFLDKILHCCDKHDMYAKVVKQIRRGSRQKVIQLMNTIDEFWHRECMQYICYNKKQECLELMLKAVQKIQSDDSTSF